MFLVNIFLRYVFEKSYNKSFWVLERGGGVCGAEELLFS